MENSERAPERETLFQARKRQWIMTTVDYINYVLSSLIATWAEAGPLLEIAMWYTRKPGP